MTNLLGLSLGEFRRHPTRTALTLSGVIIGVASVVAVILTSAATRASYGELFQTLAGRAQLEVTAAGDAAMDLALAEKLEQVPGVLVAAPSIERYTILYSQGRRFPLPAIGVDAIRDLKVRDFEIREGTYLTGEGETPEVLLDASFAGSIGVAVGDEVKMMTKAGLQTGKVVGLVAPKKAGGFVPGGSLFLDIAHLENWFRLADQATSISLLLDDKVDLEEIKASIRPLLPPGIVVQPPAARANLGQEAFKGAEQGLEFASALCLAMSAFVILNTFLMNLSERRRQLAILRAVGGTQAQIAQLLLVEALALGIIGTAIGLPLGWAGSIWIADRMFSTAGAMGPQVQLSMNAILWGAAIGPLTTLLGCAVPAVFAAKISPMEALRASAPQVDTKAWNPLTIGGVVLFVVMFALQLGVIWSLVPVWAATPVGVTLMASVVLVIPAFVGPLTKLSSAVLRPFLGYERHIAANGLVRQRTRSGFTMGVVYAAIGVALGQGTLIMNNLDDVRGWYRRTMAGDYVVRNTGAGQTGDQETMLLSDATRDELAALPGVARVDSLRLVRGEAADTPVLIVIRSLTDEETLPLSLIEGDAETIRSQLRAGEVVLGTVLANRHGWSAGDSIELKTPAGPRQVKVAGTASEYYVGGNVVIMERVAAGRLFPLEGADAYLIQAGSRERELADAALRPYCEEHGYVLTSFSELSAAMELVLASVVAGLWALQIVGFAVAGIGVVNTLTMNVLEQTREIAVMRAVGMTRWQVRRMILAQASITAVAGVVVGVLAGILTAYLMTLSMLPLLGYSLPFKLDSSLLIGVPMLAVAIVLIASLLPAERAARMPLQTALRYE